MRFPFDRTVGTRKLDYSGNIGNIVGHGMLKYEKFLRFGKQKVISNIYKVGLSKACAAHQLYTVPVQYIKT